MEELKYEILFNEPEIIFGRTLYRIVAKKTFYAGFTVGVVDLARSKLGTAVRKGDLGGYVEGGWNLSQEGSCWIGNGAAVFGKATVSENATVFGIGRFNKPTVTVRDKSKIFGCAIVKDFAQIRDMSQVCGCAVVRQYARIEDCSKIIDADIGGYACICDEVLVKGSDKILDYNAKPQRIFSKADLDKALLSVEDARSSSCRPA